MDEPRTLARWTVRPEEGGRSLVEFLCGKVPSEPRARVREAIASRVRVSWSSDAGEDLAVVAGGEVVLLDDPPDEIPVDTAFEVLARGPGWLAIAKPAGIPVHPVRSIRVNSVIVRLRRSERDPGLRLAHRLDRGTSGVLVAARDAATASRLGRAFERGAVRKEYVAVVRGVPLDPQGTIDLPIGPHPTSEIRVRLAAGHGRPARTRWWIEASAEDRARLRVVPETGRRHQIRVHLEAIGHPVLGDILYGRPDRDYLDLVEGVRDPRRDEGSSARMLLHCSRIRLDWPGLEIDARCPPGREFDLSPGGRSV